MPILACVPKSQKSIADSSTAGISRTLRERLKEDGSWRVPIETNAGRSKTDPVSLVFALSHVRQAVVLGSVLVLALVLLGGGTWLVLQASTNLPPLASPAPTAVLVEALPTAVLVEALPTAATADALPTAVVIAALPTAVVAAAERHPSPTPLTRSSAPVLAVPLQSGTTPPVGAITTATEHLGNLTVDAQLTRAIAFGVEQRLELSARSDYAPLVGAHVSLSVTNSFGTSAQVAPDTDRSGRSSVVWPTYRSVGLNQVRVLVSVGDGRELTAHLAFQGASSDD